MDDAWKTRQQQSAKMRVDTVTVLDDSGIDQ